MQIFEKEIELIRQGNLQAATDSLVHKTGIAFREARETVEKQWQAHQKRNKAYHPKQRKEKQHESL